MSAYEALTPQVRTIVDRQAESMATKLRIPVEEAREVIARRVRTQTIRPTHGMGH